MLKTIDERDEHYYINKKVEERLKELKQEGELKFERKASTYLAVTGKETFAESKHERQPQADHSFDHGRDRPRYHHSRDDSDGKRRTDHYRFDSRSHRRRHAHDGFRDRQWHRPR